MNQEKLKRAVALRAVEYLHQNLPENSILGMGTGSTVNYLIDALKPLQNRIRAAVPSSQASAARLRQQGIAIMELDQLDVASMPFYIDGADEIDPAFNMIKGGGGALTREKIVAAAAHTFICICDASKKVARLGQFPLPLEVIALASRQVMQKMQALGGKPLIRKDFITDNGNIIIDVHGLSIDQPAELETQLNQIPGLVTNGLFAHRNADLLICADQDAITLRNKSATIAC